MKAVWPAVGLVWLVAMAVLWLGGGALVHWALSSINIEWVVRLLTVIAVVFATGITVVFSLFLLGLGATVDGY